MIVTLLIVFAIVSVFDKSPAEKAVEQERARRFSLAAGRFVIVYTLGVLLWLSIGEVAERLPPEVGSWLGEYALELAILAIIVVMVRRRLTRQATVATVATSTHGGTQ